MVTLGNQKFLFHGRHLIHFRGSFSQMAACMKVPNDSSGIVLYLPTPSALCLFSTDLIMFCDRGEVLTFACLAPDNSHQ